MEKYYGKKVICTVLIFIIYILSGCSSEKKHDETVSTQTESETSVTVWEGYDEMFKAATDNNDYFSKLEDGILGASFRIIERPENATICYNGTPIELVYEGKVNYDTTISCLLFINGIPQLYCIDDNDKESYMHPVNASKDESIRVKIQFIPTIGEKGDELDVLVVPVVGASYKPLGAHDPIIPECSAGTVLDMYKLRMEADSTLLNNSIKELKSVKYTKNELGKYIFKRPDGSFENILEDAGFRNMACQNIIDNNKFRLYAEFGGGNGGEYIISAYLNGRVLCSYKAVILSGYDSRVIIDETIEMNEESMKEYDITEFNSFYYVAVPTSIKTNGGRHIQSDVGKVAKNKYVLK